MQEVGNVLQECLIPGKKYLVRIVVFEIVVPIIKGTKAELFAHSLCEPCTITVLKAALNKSTGEVIRQKPRFFYLISFCFILLFIAFSFFKINESQGSQNEKEKKGWYYIGIYSYF